MGKKKLKRMFLFATTDLDLDPSTVTVTDTETGEILDVEMSVGRSEEKRKLMKVFSVRLSDAEYDQVHRVSKKVDMTPAHFARNAIRRAVKETREGLKKKTE